MQIFNEFQKYYIKKWLPYILIILAVYFLLVIINCSKEDPDLSPQISDAHYNYGLKAIEIADRYLNFETSAELADIELKLLMERENELPQTETNHPEHFDNYLVEHSVLMLSFDLSSAKYYGESEDYQEVLNSRNSIAEAIGIEKKGE